MRPKLFALAGDHPEDWDQFVPAVVNAYNSGRHSSTGIAPSTLMFAREIRLPFDPPRPTITMSKPSDYWEFVQEFRRVTTKAVRANIREHQQHAKKRYDRNRQDPNYAPGQAVFLRQHGHTSFVVTIPRAPGRYMRLTWNRFPRVRCNNRSSPLVVLFSLGLKKKKKKEDFSSVYESGSHRLGCVWVPVIIDISIRTRMEVETHRAGWKQGSIKLQWFLRSIVDCNFSFDHELEYDWWQQYGHMLICSIYSFFSLSLSLAYA
jgi:hypothetical protein